MSNRNYRHLMEEQWSRGKFLCVGLDPDPKKISQINAAVIRDSLRPELEFLKRMVMATREVACCYKPNSAFFEGTGYNSDEDLREITQFINNVVPEAPVLLDFKRGDIGNSNKGYIRQLDFVGADACTVNGSLGQETWQPLLDRPEKGIFVLCRTSNAGAAATYDQLVFVSTEEARRLTGLTYCQDTLRWKFVQSLNGYLVPKHEHIALDVARNWNSNGNCGLVVGATAPEQLARVRGLAPDVQLLNPGVGKQGGDVQLVVHGAIDQRGQGFVINASSSILYVSLGPDFDEAGGAEAKRLSDLINQYRLQEIAA